MLMQTKSISDNELLWLTGFYAPVVVSDTGVKHAVDVGKLSGFFGVSMRTAYRWQRAGLPSNIRHILECVLSGDFLPPEWRRLGVRISAHGIQLQSGHSVSLDVLRYWPFLMRCIDWNKAFIPRP